MRINRFLVDQKGALMFDIETTAQLTGIASATLRNWEKRFGFIMPSRTDGGHRMYSIEQVLTLKQMNLLILEGQKPNQLFADLQNGHPLPEPQSSQSSLSPEIITLREKVFSELSEYRFENGSAALDSLHGMVPTVILLDCVYRWLFEKIGEQWHQKALSIASEHLITGILRSRLIKLLTNSAIHSNRQPIVFACAEGEFHEGGLLMLACHMNLRGWNCIFLGANLPTTELYEVAKRLQPAAICLSYTLKAPNWDSIQQISDLETQVCLGGMSLALHPIPELPTNIHIIHKSGRTAADTLEVVASLPVVKVVIKRSAS